MTMHQQVDELIAAFALGAVDDVEAAMVRRHLPDCGDCQANLVRMTEVVAVLPLSLEEVLPPADLKERILERVGGGPRVTTVAPPQAAPEATGKIISLFRVPTWAPVAAAAVLVAAMFGWTMSQRQGRPGVPTAASTIQATLVDGSHSNIGNVTYMKDQHLALVTFHQLASPEPGKNYELWVIPAGGRPVASGVFLPEPDGSKVLVLNHPISRGDTIAVTQEALGGTAQPTSAPIITGQL
ncbi:MAG: hypothetical protein NVS3B24_23000 [Candidatus Dormibacteria bacterium]